MKAEQVKVGMVVYDARMREYRKIRSKGQGMWQRWAVLDTEEKNFITRAPLKDLRPLTKKERGL